MGAATPVEVEVGEHRSSKIEGEEGGLSSLESEAVLAKQRLAVCGR
jgi:hypothetical protein